MTVRSLQLNAKADPEGRFGLQPDFYKLWMALSASLGGSRITALAIPLIAVVEVGVSPLQMGALASVSEAAYLLVSLPVGLQIDQVRRRPIMIAADLACAVLLLSVPLAYLWSQISFLHLCAVAAGVGLLSATGEIAQMAYIPSLVGKDHLVPANSRIQLSHSMAQSAGPGLGGLLIQLLSAPFAILTDALTYLFSAALVIGIAQPEASNHQPATISLKDALGAGFAGLLKHPQLRPITLVSMGSGLFSSGVMALFVLFATRELHLSAILIGAIFAIGGLCAIPGAMLADRAGRRFGIGGVIVWGWVLEAAAWLVIPFAFGPVAVVVLVLGLSRAVEGCTGAVANIHQWTLRQTVTPDHLQGRVTASHRFLVYGSGAIGAVLGGVLGAMMDLRTAILLCATGTVIARLAAAWTSLRRYRGSPSVVSGD
jgi:MFS family permease